MKNAWARLLTQADLKDVRIHGLGPSLRSRAPIIGASLLVIGWALGHLDPNSTSICVRLRLDPVRAGMDIAAEAILDAAKAKPKGKEDRGGDGEEN